MGSLVWWVTMVAYLAGIFPAAVVFTLHAHARRTIKPTCHGQEPKGSNHNYFWSSRNDCIRWHKPGCWYADEKVLSSSDVTFGAGWALVWPFFLLPVLTWYTVQRLLRRRPALWTPEKLAALEAELGLGEED